MVTCIYRNTLLLLLVIVFSTGTFAQNRKQTIEILPDKANKKVLILADGKAFTEFIYPDSLEKPVLYPIIAADGAIVTRGWPLAPREGDPTDHPHHIGLWMNYESINGLDFWNNSHAIPEDKKKLYGWIRTTGILSMKNGVAAALSYSADWKDQQGNVLIKENTEFKFSATQNERIIDRLCSLTALQDINMPDVKDGLLGLRVAHELEIPSRQASQFTDNKGNLSTVAASNISTGNYLTSEGKTGDSAWATRGKWCLLTGKIGSDTISIAIIDHPENPGYPTYWHARGYGLFAANPLGQKIFSNGKQEFHFSIPKGKTVFFRYRIVIRSAQRPITAAELNQYTAAFAKEK